MSGADTAALVSLRGDAIERTRSYRSPPSKTSLSTPSCELIRAVKRPDHGSKGELIDLLVNWFRIKYNRTKMYIYKVSMHEVQQQQGRRRNQNAPAPPAISHSGTVSRIFWTTVRSYRETFVNVHRIVFDDYEYMTTPDRLQMKDETRGLTLSCEHPDKPGKQVKVHFQCNEIFYLDLSGDISSNPNVQWTSIFLKNLISQHTRFIPSDKANEHEKEISERFANFNGGMFFIPRHPMAPKVEVQPGVESWLGLYASVRRMENFDPVINFGLVNKLFYKLNLDLINFYLAIENDTLSGNKINELKLDRNSCMVPDQAKNFNTKLKDVKLKCDCVPGKDKDGIVIGRVEKHYKFVELKNWYADQEFIDVEDTRAPERRREIKKNGRTLRVMRKWSRVRIDEWYAAQGKPLKYPKLPLCSVKSGKNEDLIPMEVLFTADQPQKYIKLLNFYARMKITKLLARPPVQHHKITNKLINEKLEYDKDPFMKAMNISLDPKMIECEGRRIEPCDVLAKSDSDESLTKLDLKKESGEFFISRAMETSKKRIRFVVFKLTDAIVGSKVRECYQELVKKAVNRGFNVVESEREEPHIYKSLKTVGWRNFDAIPKLIDECLTEIYQSGDEFHVFLFFTRFFNNLYGMIKYLCDIQYGIVSQVIDVETVTKACTQSAHERPSDYKSVYHHLCLKLNAKLGGVNQVVAESEPDEPEYGRMPSNEKTMFIGIDVIHPSPNSPIRDCSLGAIVASMDKNAAKYAVRIKVNTRCNENVQNFDGHFSLLLLKYQTVNGFLPERVVILRDGVSDSEMVKAASQELNSIKVAWEKCSNGVKYPQFTYIVVQKSHKTRFYRRSNEENGEVSNPPMGTVVDKAVVTPHMFDFYMVSHYTQLGTTRPIHYTVVYDDCESSADVVQEMLFRMCFLYARCSKPVSLPSPVYYAHLACERAAFHHEYALEAGIVREIVDIGTGETPQQYATRVESQALDVEKELQVSDKYPGMHFI